jgi:hypothetical protein
MKTCEKSCKLKKGRDFEKTLNVKYKNFSYRNLQPKLDWLENRNSYSEMKDESEK